MTTNILFVGDIVGGLGKRTLLGLLPSLRERLAVDFVVVNGENIAGGVGITPKLAEQLFKLRGRTWILNSYLNDVPYGTVNGQNAYGVGAAAQNALVPRSYSALRTGLPAVKYAWKLLHSLY